MPQVSRLLISGEAVIAGSVGLRGVAGEGVARVGAHGGVSTLGQLSLIADHLSRQP